MHTPTVICIWSFILFAQFINHGKCNELRKPHSNFLPVLYAICNLTSVLDIHKRIKRWQKRSMIFEIISHFSYRTKKNPLFLHILKWIEWTILNFGCVVFFGKIEINMQVMGKGNKCNHGGTCLAYSTNFFIYFIVCIFFSSFFSFFYLLIWLFCVCVCIMCVRCVCASDVGRSRHYSMCRYLTVVFFSKLFFNPFREVRMGFFLLYVANFLSLLFLRWCE